MSALGSLEARIALLADHLFLPGDLAEVSMSDAAKARSAAFLVLVHAEIEHGIEEECRKVADGIAVQDPATAMLVWGAASITLKVSPEKLFRDHPLEHVTKAYKGMLSRNHGIKKKHMVNLLRPIGIDLKPLNIDLEVLEEFGDRRGKLAHIPIGYWVTNDVPSAIRTSGIQAAKSADNIIGAIKLKCGTVFVGGRVLMVKRWVSRCFKSVLGVL